MTAYGKHRLVTFAHGFHQTLKVGDIIALCSVIRNTMLKSFASIDYVLLDSGGGCLSKEAYVSYGITVGCEMIGISGNTTLHELNTRHLARAHIVV